MVKTRIGKLAPRYSFMLNPHTEVRLSRCPKCRKATHLRKFALFIHIDEWGPMVLGKTCRYCSRCAMVMVHGAELETELAYGLSQIAPQVIAKHYLVLGTMEKKIWREGLDGEAKPLAGMLEHVADFKLQYELQYEPANGIRPLREQREPSEPTPSNEAPIESLTGVALANRRASQCLPQLQSTLPDNRLIQPEDYEKGSKGTIRCIFVKLGGILGDA
jgi:hypothetical protein